MDIINNEVERGIMSEKKPNKTQIMTLAIAGAGLIIVILLVLLLTGSSSKNTGATTNETGITAKASSSSSSTKTYVEGKDYSVKYSNEGIIDKATIDNSLSSFGINEPGFLIEKNTGAYSKVEIFYNKEKNMLIFKFYKFGNSEPNSIARYSIQDKKVMDGRPQTTDYENMPVVYTWTNLTK